MLTEFFKPKTSEPPTKRARIESGEKPPSPSPTPSPATLVASSAEQSDAFKAPISDPNASFASMRSTSSKRIITSSGQQLVMGSDSDTDEDLEDLDTLLNRSKSKPKPAGTDLFGDFRSSNVIPKKQEQKKYTFNLSRLVEEQRQQTAMEVRIGEAQANLHEASKEAAAASASPNKDTIQAVLTENTNTEDGGRARRVMEALERTDAFERHDVWHFFEEQPLKLPRNPFPRISHSNAMLKATLNDPERRRQSFASGFLQRIAGTIPLPDELLSWLMLEVCRESKDVLLSAYMETLFQAADSTSSCLSSESLLHCFRTLGARSEALDARSPIRHRPVAANVWDPSATASAEM